MRQGWKNLLSLGVLILLSWYISGLKYSECEIAKNIWIGQVDAKFNLNTSQIENSINAAINIWGSNLLKLSNNNPIVVNFIYDERTALNSQINNLEKQLDSKNTDLKKRVIEYENKVKLFKQKLIEYNNEVNKWNSQGGAPEDEYKKLLATQQQLQIEGDSLNKEAKTLNLATENYNSQVGNLNNNVKQYNQAISQKPEEGLYDGGNRTITIFFAGDKNELIHTLAHEFGHALGMNHVANPKAIMYPNTSKTLTVTNEDQEQLEYVCRQQPRINLWVNKYRDWLLFWRQKFFTFT